jgi:hypothetical protein
MTLFVFTLVLFPRLTLIAQNNVGIGTQTPSADAVLDLFATNKGFLTPRVTSIERASIPAASNGLLVFDTDVDKFFYWDASQGKWQIMDDFSNTNEVIKLVTFDETTKELSLQDLGGTYTLDLNILSQNLSFSNDTLFISDKNEIFLGDYHKDSSATNELITNTNFNTTSKDLSITDAGQTFNNDLSILSQTLDLTSDVLSISDQNDVNLSIYHNDSSATNELITVTSFNTENKDLSITDAGQTFNNDLSILSQTIDLTSDVLSISDQNNVDLSIYHNDSSATNELITVTSFNTENKDLSITDAGQTFNNDLSILSQTIDLTGDVLSISDQNNVDLSIYHKDSSATNELITVTSFNTTSKDLSITEAGQTFNNDLSILSQTIDLTGDVLSISDQNDVNLSIYHKDSSASNEIQGLSTSNDTIFMDRGGFAKLTETDFWNTDGNVGTSPLSNFIGTRDNTDFVLRTNNVENMRIKSTGDIGIGTDIPDEKLDVFGNIELSGGNRTVQTQVMTANGTGFSLTLKASDNKNNGFNAQNGGNVIVQGGKGFNWSTGAGGGHVVIRSGANETQAGAGFRDGGYIVFQTGAKNNTFIERARMLDNGNFGLGTTSPSSQLDLTEQIRIRGGNPGLGKVLTSDANGLATWQNGLPDVNNGLYVNTGANRIRLGGPLVENTTITQGAFGMTYNLNGSGDFNIQDNGVNTFAVSDNGNAVFGGDVEWRDGNTGGTLLAQVFDDGNDGRFTIMENGITSVDLDANTQFVFNEQGLDRNFRVESDVNANMIFAHAKLNRLGIGTSTPDEVLDVQGNIELSGGNRVVQTEVMTSNGTGFSLTLKASDNKNNGFNAQNGGNVIVQGGKGFNWSTGAGGGHVVIRSGANETQANAGFRDGGYIVFQTGAKNNTFIERARMLDNGNFGIGTTTPGYKLQVGNSGDGSSARANSWNTFSDRRWKTKIELISNALEKLDQISGYTYKWKVGTDTTTQVGVIAQEIELVLPEAVKTDAEGYKSVDYGKLSALLIEAVKEQQITISLLENQIQQQKMRTDSIESRLNKLEKL